MWPGVADPLFYCVSVAALVTGEAPPAPLRPHRRRPTSHPQTLQQQRVQPVHRHDERHHADVTDRHRRRRLLAAAASTLAKPQVRSLPLSRSVCAFSDRANNALDFRFNCFHEAFDCVTLQPCCRLSLSSDRRPPLDLFLCDALPLPAAPNLTSNYAHSTDACDCQFWLHNFIIVMKCL